MGPFKAIGVCYAGMLNFTGRARRAEYWWFVVWQFVFGTAATALAFYYLTVRAQSDPAFAAILANPDAMELFILRMFEGYEIPIIVGYLIAFAIPSLAVTIRRLHDTNRSGWNIFMPTIVGIFSSILGLFFIGTSVANGSSSGVILSVIAMYIPMTIASIWFLVWLCLPGTNGNNRFGSDPVKNRPAPEPDHPAFASKLHGEARDRSEEERKAAARDYYKRRVLPSIQKV